MLPKRILALVDRKLRMLPCIAMCVLLSCAPYMGYKRWESNWYRSLIPSEIEVGNAVLIDGESGFLEGCGVAIFEITPQMRERMRLQGAATLNGTLAPKTQVRTTRDTRMWVETPYVETGDGMTLEDSWQTGLSCVKTNRDLVRVITAALRQPGSFVKKLHEAAVVVVPASGVAALVYFG